MSDQVVYSTNLINNYDELALYCRNKLEELNLKENKYQERLNWELAEIKAKEKTDYFISLFNKKTKYPFNQNNLLVVFLLGVVSDFNINEDPSCVYGDLPDVDLDFIPQVRDYLKNEWAPKTFGEDYVCNIANYQTFGIKMALLDMARVHGCNHQEIQALTKNIAAKDDDNKPISWDAAMRLYPDLKLWCDNNQEAATAAKKLLNRCRGSGVHAGGLIISSVPLKDFVPLIKNEEELQASAWTEGLHDQDLQPVGLIKFDLLVISTLLQIYEVSKLVKQRRNLNSICALPGQEDWTDVDLFRNDKLALEMANKGDLKCVFQFDSPGIRKLVKSGGVDRFEDLVAYTSLYRPACMTVGMHTSYVERKKGNEKYEINPVLLPVLETTYGILVFQEQVMKILNLAGKVPLKECEVARKAISKKKIEGFIGYKEMFIKNGQEILGYSEQEISDLWDQIEAFSGYGFNKSHSVCYTYNSSAQLYLKAHYPAEFYVGMLIHETDTDTIRDYKMEAKAHGIIIKPLDINKSKANVAFNGDEIYMGFSKIKGIGDNAAERIVENQPYSSFQDFLDRCGTDAGIIKPIVGLRLFNDADPITTWKYYEYYKDKKKKNKDKEKKYYEYKIKYESLLEELFGEKIDLFNFDINNYKIFDSTKVVEELVEKECFEKDHEYFREVEISSPDAENEVVKVKTYFKKVIRRKKFNKFNEAEKILKRWNKFLLDYQQLNSDKNINSIKEFDSSKIKIEKEKEVLDLLKSKTECELAYYGFQWENDVEEAVVSADASVSLATFSQVLEDNAPGPVDVKINKIEKKQGPKVAYWRLICEDGYCEKGLITVWNSDYEKFKKEFSEGNILRIRVKPPTGNYSTYTFDSLPSSGNYYNKVNVDKKNDFRVVLWKSKLLDHDKVLDNGQ